MTYESMTDRELDALVAEKVMGWPSKHLTPKVFFRPCLDVAQAFEVVEAMRERGSDYFVLMHDEGNKWGAAFSVEAPWRGGKAWKQYESDNQDNPARAICIAALRALDA